MIAPKPPYPPKITPRRLERRLSLTIAIGVIASDGIVIAADRQESSGYQKTDEGKITGMWKANPFGSVIITGSGASSSLDSISAKLRSWFHDESISDRQFPEGLELSHRTFYESNVMPIARYDNERVDYSLIVGYASPRTRKIWYTDALNLVEVEDYWAVGMGAPAAKAILSKLWLPLPVSEAVNLAAFALSEVKASTDYCGLGSDLTYTTAGQMVSVSDDDVEEMERAFAKFRISERTHFHRCMGHDDQSPFMKNISGRCEDYEGRVRAVMAELTSKRPIARPPSVSHSSGDQQ